MRPPGAQGNPQHEPGLAANQLCLVNQKTLNLLAAQKLVKYHASVILNDCDRVPIGCQHRALKLAGELSLAEDKSFLSGHRRRTDRDLRCLSHLGPCGTFQNLDTVALEVEQQAVGHDGAFINLVKLPGQGALVMRHGAKPNRRRSGRSFKPGVRLALPVFAQGDFPPLTVAAGDERTVIKIHLGRAVRQFDMSQRFAGRCLVKMERLVITADD